MTNSLVSIALGVFRFSLLQAAYDELRHSHPQRWEGVDRAGAHPALQWAGAGQETLVLRGVIFPQHLGAIRYVQLLRAEAARAEPMLLIDGLGFFWGKWVIANVDETQRHHLADGAPRRQDYSIELLRYEPIDLGFGS
ncbi:MAG: phage tail protein [Pseudomonadota bacterium]